MPCGHRNEMEQCAACTAEADWLQATLMLGLPRILNKVAIALQKRGSLVANRETVPLVQERLDALLQREVAHGHVSGAWSLQVSADDNGDFDLLLKPMDVN